MNHLRFIGAFRVQRYDKIWRFANIWRRKIGKICEIEEKVVILQRNYFIKDN